MKSWVATYIRPAISEEPNCGTMPRITVQSRDIFGLSWVAALPGPDFRFRAINLDVARRAAGVRFAGVCAADIRDFEHHVRFPVFVPEGDTDIGSAVSCRCYSTYSPDITMIDRGVGSMRKRGSLTVEGGIFEPVRVDRYMAD